MLHTGTRREGTKIILIWGHSPNGLGELSDIGKVGGTKPIIIKEFRDMVTGTAKGIAGEKKRARREETVACEWGDN